MKANVLQLSRAKKRKMARLHRRILRQIEEVGKDQRKNQTIKWFEDFPGGEVVRKWNENESRFEFIGIPPVKGPFFSA